MTREGFCASGRASGPRPRPAAARIALHAKHAQTRVAQAERGGQARAHKKRTRRNRNRRVCRKGGKKDSAAHMRASKFAAAGRWPASHGGVRARSRFDEEREAENCL